MEDKVTGPSILKAAFACLRALTEADHTWYTVNPMNAAWMVKACRAGLALLLVLVLAPLLLVSAGDRANPDAEDDLRAEISPVGPILVSPEPVVRGISSSLLPSLPRLPFRPPL